MAGDPRPVREYRRDPTATVARARELRGAMTPHEVKLWLRLRELKPQGFRFRRQVRIERWIADFACFTTRLIVEVDGSQHGFDENRVKDTARDAFLEHAGFIALRFTNSEVWENIDGVVETVFLNGQPRLPPSLGRSAACPSPPGGGMILRSEKSEP
jgi:very-short-patch-repair endonuclease